MINNSREAIIAAIDHHEWGTAKAALQQLFLESPTLSNAQFVLTQLSKVIDETKRLPFKLFFMRSFTLEPVLPILKAYSALYGIALETAIGEFNTYSQEILDPNSALYRTKPGMAVLAFQTRDLLPNLWNKYTEMTPEDVQLEIDNAISNLKNLFQIFRSRSQASMVVHNLEMPSVASAGVLDSQNASSQLEAIKRCNRELLGIACEYSGIYLLDYDSLIARHGRDHWHDERKWLTMRMPITADCLHLLAKEYLHFLLPVTGKLCKALVCDLDNTLWGGVIGEDGMEGIRLGSEYPGASHLALQRAILDLYNRGVILAVNSKNNLADAMEAIDNHPGMLLRPHHFAAFRINWQDKAQNIKEIANELNIGIDSIAFIDDNPVERERVRAELPEVTVLDLPEDPLQYASIVRDSPVFARLTLSNEDHERGKIYAEQRQRLELHQNATSIEDYYRSLKMELQIAPSTTMTLGRIAQLTQKTNQFNLTTKRYSEQQVEELGGNPDWQIYSFSVRDVFGDNGIVGVAFLRKEDETFEIDTLLMSCRVIGRTVETAMISLLADKAKCSGANSIWGWFLPTKKNVPAAEFFSDHKFTKVREEESGQLWKFDLSNSSISFPEWIKLEPS